MEEMEDPTERIQEELHRSAHEAKEKWVSGVALTSALLAVSAAVTGLLSGDNANEAMIEQIQASDHWSYYQAKGIKAAVLSTKMEMAALMGKSKSEKDEGKLKDYKKEQDEISAQAKEKEESSKSHLRHHVVFARGVTLFQVAIGVAAISALTRRRKFWYVGLFFGAVGLAFLIEGLLMK